MAFLAIKISLGGFSPLGLAVARHAVALPFWFWALWARRIPVAPPPGQRLRYLWLGLLMVPVYHLALNAAETRLDSGLAGLVIASAPLWVAVADAGLFRRPVPGRKWTGGLVALSGVALASGVRPEAVALGHLGLAFVAPVAAALYTGFAHDLARRDGPLAFSAWTIMGGTFLLAPVVTLAPGWWLSVQGVAPTPGQVWAVVALGVGSTLLGTLAFVWLVRHHGAVNASGWLFFVPVVAVLAGGLIAGEPLGPFQVGGMALVAAGVWWANRPARTQPAGGPATS